MDTTRVRACVSANCPVAEAESRIEAYFAQRRGPDGIAHLPLRVSLPRLPLLRGLSLEHDVTVTAYRDRDDQNLNDLIRIAWEPEGGGAFPKFKGTLVAWAEHDPEMSFIEIDGTYAPPLGVAGELFDEAVGETIAEHTAQTLLRDIARAISAPAAMRA